MATATTRRRPLDFRDFGAVVADVDQLHRGGHERSGQWDLAQACDHLAYFIDSSVDGASFRVPWLLKVLFGRMMLRRILATRRMKEGVPVPDAARPKAGADEAAAVERLKRSIARFEGHGGELKPSPFFGTLTRGQWRDLHLIHCAHHLSFLSPAGSR